MRIPLERFFQQPPIAGRALAEVAWHPANCRFTYLEPAEGEDPSNVTPQVDLWAYQLETGVRERVLRGEALGCGDETPPLRGYRWFPDGARLLLCGRGTVWQCGISDLTVARLLTGIDERVEPTFSPAGDRLAFVRGNNLCILDLTTGEERALTADGDEDHLNGVLDWAYWEELGNRRSWRAFEWSPDGSRIALLRLDQSRVPKYPLVDWMALHPPVTRQRYPKAGDPNSAFTVRILDARNGRFLAEHREASDATYAAPQLRWTPDGQGVAFTRLTRDQRSLELRLLEEGGSRVLLTETDPHWLNPIGPPLFLSDGGFLWLSERSGRAHLYRYGANGALCHPVTEGAWQVEAVLGHEADHVYCTGTGEDPRERHLYRARLDGADCERLTRGAGVHQTLLRDDCAWSLVTRQTPDTPPETCLVRTESGATVTVRPPDPGWREYEWPEARFVELAADDGSTLYGRLLLPLDFDPSRRYPVVAHVYGGPHAQTVQKVWTGGDPLEQILARAGIICWRLDNRGSWGRGHAFEAPVDRRLGEMELRDQLAGVDYLRSLPFVDAERIGITGWSYGGYLTLYAMTHSPEVWRCGVAGAPVTAWTLYDSIYTERYMGTPGENPEGYRRASPLESAEGLAAPLLLVHGTDDDNVHLQHTLQFVEALSRHRKPYELLIQPKQKHGFRGEGPETYLHERMLEFFRRHLGLEG